MFGNPQDIVTMIAAASILFGAGGAAVRAGAFRPHAAAPLDTADVEAHDAEKTSGTA